MADKLSAIHHTQPSIAFDMSSKPQSSLTHASKSNPSSSPSSASASTSHLLPLPSILPRILHPMATNSHIVESHARTMAASPSKEAKKFDISSLMSPPDPVIDSFNSAPKTFSMSNSSVHGGNGQQASSKHPLPMSPPISPYSKHIASNDAPTTPPSSTIKDPVLYPADDRAASSPPQPPLFATAELEDHRHIVEDHLRAQSPTTFGTVAPPRREDYMLVLACHSRVMQLFNSDRKGWLRKERARLVADRQAGASRYATIMPAKPIAAKPPRARGTDRVSKPHGQGQGAPRSIRTQAPGATAPWSHSQTPARPSARISATPEPSRRVVAPNREDKDFNSLPNYCPPVDSLPTRGNSLKVDWKGQAIDLSNDPHAHLLHPDEILLAANLRLDCATYLTSKRRIFDRRLTCLRNGKEFRKTDAQQACKIDVNKASKLWTAFEKVGWLEAHWVKRFL